MELIPRAKEFLNVAIYKGFFFILHLHTYPSPLKTAFRFGKRSSKDLLTAENKKLYFPKIPTISLLLYLRIYFDPQYTFCLKHLDLNQKSMGFVPKIFELCTFFSKSTFVESGDSLM